jgi:poly(3-hydroxybutyrate) depolymerase
MVKRILTMVFLSWTSLALFAENPVKITFHSGDYDREYLRYTPENSQYEHPFGIIVCLHGFNRSMEDFFNEYNFSEIADSLNYIILAPQALPEQDQNVINDAKLITLLSSNNLSLNSVWSCGLSVKAGFYLYGVYIPILNEKLNKSVDDTGFIASIIDHTRNEYGLAAGNTFVFGTSMGGYMAYQLALEQGDKLSGLISMAGSMGLSVSGTEKRIKTPICDFHSVTDEIVPYIGSYVQSGISISLAQDKQRVIDYWVENNSAGSPIIENVQYYPSNKGITVEKITYPAPVYEVIHYKINGAGHSYFFREEDGDCMDYIEETIKFIKAHATANPNGIKTIPVSARIFYPNPAPDIIHFGSMEGNVLIFDLSGKKIFSQSFHSGQLDISSLKPGMYIIRIQSDGNSQTTKLIKQ